MPEGLRLEVSRSLSDDDVYAVAMLIERAAEADGVRPLSEQVVLHLLHSNDVNQTHVCAWRGAALAGYGHLDWPGSQAPPIAEMAVDARWQAGGDVAGAVLDALVAASRAAMELWAHGAHSPSRSAAESRGFIVRRELLRMSRPLSGSLPKASVPPGVAIRAFDPESDARAWLDLNARAFAALPDQGGWTADDLALRLAEPWFDADGFLLAHETQTDGSEGALIGFHWTKVHDDAGHPHGEVYVLAVDPETQSRGLGRALTILGLQHLKGLGLREVTLYVDAGNAAALHTYQKLGFQIADRDFLFSTP